MSDKKNDAASSARGKAGGTEQTTGWDSVRLGGASSGGTSVYKNSGSSKHHQTTTINNPYTSRGEAAAINVHENTEHMTLADLLAKDIQLLADKAMKDMLMGENDDNNDDGFDDDDDEHRMLKGGKRRRPGSQYDPRFLDKATILQEAKRLFNDSYLVRDHPLHCATVLIQLYQLEEGCCSSSKQSNQRLTQVEAIDIFFGVSKLFLSPHPSLRRLVYLFLKVLLNTQLIPSSDVIIIQSCLTKDMVCPLALYKANSLRVLVQMMNPPMLSSVERYMKSMLVDFSTKCDAIRSSSSLVGSNSSSTTSMTSLAESARVSSAALISAIHLSLNNVHGEKFHSATPKNSGNKNTTAIHNNNECAMIIQRWVAEVHDAMVQPAMVSSSTNNSISMQQQKLGGMVQFHAIMLLYIIKNHDRRAIQRLIMEWSMSKKSMSSGTTTASNNNANTIQGMFGRMRDTMSGDSNKNRRDKRSKAKGASSMGSVQLISPLSAVLGIRIITKYIRDEYRDGRTKEMELSSSNTVDDLQSCYHKIYSCLTHFSAMVAYEAARSIGTLLPESSSHDIATAIDVLHSLLKANASKQQGRVGKPCIRLASIRTLYQISQTHPSLVSRANDDLKYLIADPNRMVGTLAITTLLQTSASSVAGDKNTSSSMFLDTCLAQICKFVHIVVEDDYRVHIVESLKKLCLIHPGKHQDIINILGTFLRDEGGYKFKKRVVQIMISIMVQLTRSDSNSSIDISPSAIEVKDRTLSWLCEYVEDCVFVNLSTYVLHLIGIYGTEHVTMMKPNARTTSDYKEDELEHYLHEQTNNASKYIRFVYNRYMLERAPIRAAAITTLQKFGICIPSLRRSIWILLKNRAIYDNHDEVRDRATLAVSTLESLLREEEEEKGISGDSSSKNDDVNGLQTTTTTDDDHHPTRLEAISQSCMVDPLPMSFDQLEQCLRAYRDDENVVCKKDNNMNNGVTDESSLKSLITFDTLVPYMKAGKGTASGGGKLASGVRLGNNESQYMNGSMAIVRNNIDMTNNDNGDDNNVILPTKVDPAAALYDVPELAALGSIWKSCVPAVDLTERETEYVVSCIKHIYMDQQHVLLQFIVENTIETQCLKNVTVAIELMEHDNNGQYYSVVGEVPALSVPYGRRENCFTLLKRMESSAGRVPPSIMEMHCELHFSVISVDPMTGEEEDMIDQEEKEEYALDGMTIQLSDFIVTKKHNLKQSSFKEQWEQLGRDFEVMEKFALKQHRSIKDALKAIIHHLGLQPCDGTDFVNEDSASKSHIVHLRGSLLGTTEAAASDHHPVLARAQLSIPQQPSDRKQGIILKIAVRSNNLKVSQAIADSVV